MARADEKNNYLPVIYLPSREQQVFSWPTHLHQIFEWYLFRMLEFDDNWIAD
jgi:hypothetical protein